MTAERRFPKLDMQPLSGIMARLGHTWIDVLKVSFKMAALAEKEPAQERSPALPFILEWSCA